MGLGGRWDVRGGWKEEGGFMGVWFSYLGMQILEAWRAVSRRGKSKESEKASSLLAFSILKIKVFIQELGGLSIAFILWLAFVFSVPPFRPVAGNILNLGILRMGV